MDIDYKYNFEDSLLEVKNILNHKENNKKNKVAILEEATQKLIDLYSNWQKELFYTELETETMPLSNFNRINAKINNLIFQYLQNIKKSTTEERKLLFDSLSNSENSEQIKLFFKIINNSLSNNDIDSINKFTRYLKSLLASNSDIFFYRKLTLSEVLTIRRMFKVVKKIFITTKLDTQKQLSLLNYVEKKINLFYDFNDLYFNSLTNESDFENSIFSRKITSDQMTLSVKDGKDILIGLIQYLELPNKYIEYINSVYFQFVINNPSKYQDSFEEKQLWTSYPIVFINWNFDINSLFLAAHELGHAIYEMEYGEIRKSLSEVPSSLFENYLFQYLLSESSPLNFSERSLVKKQYQYIFLDRVFGQAMIVHFMNDIIKSQNFSSNFVNQLWYKTRYFYLNGNKNQINKYDHKWLMSPHILRGDSNFNYLKNWLVSIYIIQEHSTYNLEKINEYEKLEDEILCEEGFNFFKKLKE
ncbi:hypothetical protein AB3331_03145 [Streptococcus sp. H49]|uniref:hypothetical protein n=1 Tax=Streptococcus huangxiaojuni TaxID=3237239 RepID=UPI0034A264D9